MGILFPPQMGGKELGTPNRVEGKGSVLETSPESLRFMPAKIMTEFRCPLCQLPCLVGYSASGSNGQSICIRWAMR